MPQRVRLITAALLIGAASSAAARDLFVNNATGDDRLTGLKPAISGNDGPVRSINRALALALPSDRLVIANTGRPYREAIAISGACLRGSARRPFVIESDGAVLDGSVSAASGAWRHVSGNVFALRPRRLTHQQLFNAGEPLRRVEAPIANAGGVSLRPLEWALTGNAVLLRVEESRLPESYDLRHAGLQTGVTLYNTEHVVIDGLVIQGFQQDGVNAHELAKDCVLRNVEARANGRSGLSVGGASRVRVVESRFYDNGRVQVRTEQLARVAIERSEVDEATAPPFSASGASLTVDGRFVVGGAIGAR